MDLVVNEWLPEYFRPEAAEEEKKQLQAFLNRFMERQDRMIVREPSPFLEKIYRYAKEYQTDDQIVRQLRLFIKQIPLDSNRCSMVSDEKIGDLPESVLEKLEVGNYGSDRFLFEAASCIESEKIIVTTDGRLKDHFADEDWCRLVLLAEWLEGY